MKQNLHRNSIFIKFDSITINNDCNANKYNLLTILLYIFYRLQYSYF